MTIASNEPILKGRKDNLFWQVFNDRSQMGQAAARDLAQRIKEVLREKPEVNIIFASAPSQNDLLASLAEIKGLDWSKVNAFHMDEYIGLPEEAPQKFSIYLRDGIFRKVKPGRVFYINGSADPDEECRRYTKLLEEYPVDIVCLGIGENGHLAFNDPHVADFNDPLLIKMVNIDDTSRMQQVHDGNFSRIEEVPKLALSLTIPALLKARFALTVVPGPTKAQAVFNTLNGPISEKCPATALRRHPGSFLYLDRDSAALLK